MTALQFIDALKIIGLAYPNGIPKRELFSLAKQFQYSPVKEVTKLLCDETQDHRLAAVSILDWKARHKKTTAEEKGEIYKAYMENHKYIDDWGMVDRAAPHVVGGYLYDKDRTPLYKLAKSTNPMERRTAMVSTYYFIRKNEIDDTFKIAELLAHDTEHFVQTAVGSWLREAGKRDEYRLKAFLDKYAATLPRVTLRFAIEKFTPQLRKHYLSMAKQK